MESEKDHSKNKSNSNSFKKPLIVPLDECLRGCTHRENCKGINYDRNNRGKNKSRNITHTSEKNCPYKLFLVSFH